MTSLAAPIILGPTTIHAAPASKPVSTPARAAAPKPAKAAAKPAKPAAKAAPKPTYSALQPQSDQQLQKAAQDIADTQVNGGLAQLAQIMARNQAQTAGAQKQTAGLFSGLGQQVQASNAQLGQIGSGLNDTLSQIGNQSQQQLAGAFQPSPQLQKLDAQGLGGGGVQALAQALAQQQGYAGQDAQAFRAAGATQGANYGSLGASNLGTSALRGQEAILGIGKAGQLADQKSTDAENTLAASKGSVYQEALGKLTDSEANRELARQTLGIKATVANTGAAAQQSTAAHQVRADTTAAQTAATNASYKNAIVGLRQVDQQLKNTQLSETQRHDLAGERLRLQTIRSTAQKAAAKGVPVTSGQRSAAGSLKSNVASLVPQFRKAGANTGGVTSQALGAGFSKDEINIARDIAVLGHVSPPNRAAALRLVGGNASLLPPAWGI